MFIDELELDEDIDEGEEGDLSPEDYGAFPALRRCIILNEYLQNDLRTDLSGFERP